MLAKEMVSDIVPSLKTSDTGISALNWMDIFKVSHLPIVNNKEFLGLVSENDIYDLNMPEEPLGNHQLSLVRPYVLENHHVFEIMSLASRLKLSLIPVLSNKKAYMGVITITELLHFFTNLSALNNPGGIVILELNHNDYSLAEIAQIIEGNDAKILGTYITSNPNSTKIELTLKLNVTNVTSIVQTFNRYDYTIKNSFMRHDEEEDLLEDRYNLLMKFLDT
ncbi:MAG: CBS domain-containing protein [Bacteroidales bacterium]